MSKSKGLLLDIGITLIVLIIATVLLGITNYRNNQEGVALEFTQIAHNLSSTNLNNANSVHVLNSLDEARAIFPNFNPKVNWDTDLLLTYIGSPQASTGYQLTATRATHQGPVSTIFYQLEAPVSNTVNLGVTTQPILFVTLNREDVESGNIVVFRFQDIDSNQTTSLNMSADEIE